MIILSAQNIAKAFGVNTVLRDVSLTVQQGDRIGLVGVNGAANRRLCAFLQGWTRKTVAKFLLFAARAWDISLSKTW